MTNSASQRRPFGASGLQVPPIMFRTAALANVPRVIPEQRKLAICGEWFRHVEPPVFIDATYKHGDGLALEVLGRMLRRLDVTSEEVVIHLTLDSHRVKECWEQSCRLLGDEYLPKFVSVVDPDDHAWQAVCELKSAKLVLGAGLTTSDIRELSQLLPPADSITLERGFTLMHHPKDVLNCMADLAVATLCSHDCPTHR